MVIHPDENSVMIGSWDIPKYALFVFFLVTAAVSLYFAGFYKAVKTILYHWLFDHTTNRFTINNGARVLVLFAFLYVFIGSHVTFQIKPHLLFQMSTMSEWEMGIILAFIIGQEWVKKTGTPTLPINTTQETYTRTETDVNTVSHEQNNHTGAETGTSPRV